ncbi:DUF1828 domain-containing protein [Methylovorus glucosotrophus]|uniref:DUF1828 domain-containing protein n=1 Tax=Methylovorus glucosotrophus (strain SIP3-4) TaxID=582744 RepID=C6XDU8_METGS|nr:DUF1828 domain-containing protein [Methylovorus glucosotrophus]ACT50723.1 Domain of unknown function DUF1828 [Methylovorus glucosotrophus SIP3-4]
MLTCEWVQALTKFDCRSVRTLDGSSGLEVGTPFSLPDGSAINLYLVPASNQILISDNGDTVAHLSGMGLDIWQQRRLKSLRDAASNHKLCLTDEGDFRALATNENASFVFAQVITGLLAVSQWAAHQMNVEVKEHDIAAEAEPYILARSPNARFIKNPKVMGASRALHTFDFQHGNELIDVISANPLSTGSVMRKVGDVTNGPYIEGLSPLIIVDDRIDSFKARNEMSILASIARTQPFSILTRARH